MKSKQRTVVLCFLLIAIAGLWTLPLPKTSSHEPRRIANEHAPVAEPPPSVMAVDKAGGLEAGGASLRIEPSPDSSQTHSERARALSAARALAGRPISAAEQLSIVEADFRTRFEADPEFAAYTACLATEQRCEEIFSSIFYSVLYSGFANDLEDHVFELPAEGTPEAAELSARLMRVITGNDPVKRATALVLVNRVDSLFVRELPAEAYEGISALSVAEQQLLLERHAFVPLPSDAAADEVAAFGRMTKDSRALSAAVLALGHPGTDEQLAGLLGDITIDGDVRRDLSRVIGLCADECPQTIRRLYGSQQPDDHAALARAIDFCPETKVESLREAVREISSGELVLELPRG